MRAFIFQCVQRVLIDPFRFTARFLSFLLSKTFGAIGSDENPTCWCCLIISALVFSFFQFLYASLPCTGRRDDSIGWSIGLVSSLH